MADIIKITGTAYKLLDYLPEGDPLKIKAKEKVLAILERPTAEDIDMLKKYFEVMKMQGWIDGMNVIIIKNHYDLLLQEIPNKPQVKKSEKEGNFSERQQKILKFLEINKKAQVADLLKDLPKVTKRTIRRDLDDLLKRGRIIRAGTFNQVVYEIGHVRTI